MAVAFDAAATPAFSNAGVTSLTANLTVSGGSDRFVVACVLSGAGTPLQPSAVKWGGSGGTAMSQLGTTINIGSNVKLSFWGLVAPASGANTIYASWASAQDETAIVGSCYTGVDQSTPTRTVASATGSDATPTVGATSVSGDIVVDCVGFLDGNGAALTLSVGANQTSRGEVEGSNLTFEGLGNSSETATTTTTTMSWTVSGTPLQGWGIFAAALIASTGSTLEQEGFRFGIDDGNEASHTWDVAQDTNTTVALSVVRLLRLIVDATGDPSGAAYTLRYQKNGSGGYQAVNVGSTQAVTLDLAVTAGADDAQQSGTTMTVTGTTIGASLDATTEWVGIRFQNVTVPQGATITAAYLSVVPSGTGEDEPLVTIACQDADNGAAFTTTASDITNRTLTSTVSWSSTDLGATGTSYHNTPSLVTPVQAVVNRGGWASGNAMVFVFQGGSTSTRDLTIKSFENAGGTPPLLHIEYTVPAEIYVTTSANITAGGEATTARLTPPGAKSTSDFTTGRRWDDENGSDSIDIAADQYTEVEWCLTVVSPAANTDYYDFRVYNGSGALNTYTVTPRLTISTGGITTTKVMTDTAVLSDPQVQWKRAVRRTDETLALVDSIVKSLTGSGLVTVKTMTDALVLTEQVVQWLRRKRDGLDTVLLTDDPNRIIQMIADDLVGDLTDSQARALARGRVATETLTLSDETVRWRRLRRVMDDSQTLLDSFIKALAGAGTIYTKVMSEAFDVSDGSVRYLRYRRTTSDNLDLLDAFSKTLAGAGITYAKVMSDSVVLLDDAGNRWKYVRSQVNDTLQLQDGSVSGAIRPRTQSDALAFADSLTRWVRLVRQVGDTVEFTDGMVRIRSMVRSYSDSLGITDEAIRSLFFDQLQPTNFRLGMGLDPFIFGTGSNPVQLGNA